MGILFEIIVAGRILSHLSLEDHEVADRQYGFRKQRSTIDAISRVVSTERSYSGVVLTVMLDTINAFNILP